MWPILISIVADVVCGRYRSNSAYSTAAQPTRAIYPCKK